MGQSAGKDTPVLENGVLYTNDVLTTGTRIDTPRWYEWTLFNTAFYYKTAAGGFSMRKEKRRRGAFWYAYKRINGKLVKRYVGTNMDVTAKNLAAIAAEMLPDVAKIAH